MENVLNDIYIFIMELVNNSIILGPLFACFLIFIESILPVLPLFVFITINFIAFGYFFGFVVSYILTILGCLFSFWLCRKFFKNLFTKKLRKSKNFDKVMKTIDNITFPSLVVITAIPFTPAFLINIAASLSKMQVKKFFYAILIGKISLIFFWGFIGTSLIESLKNPKIIVLIIIILIIAYFFSKFINKKIDIE